MPETNFYIKYAQLMKVFQCIEFDTKYIYEAMKVGNVILNKKEINRITLGATVNLLYKLDNSDNIPHLSEADYKLLSDITNIRNYYAHQCFTEYVYSGNNINENFAKVSRRLVNDFNRVSKLASNIEEFRISMVQGRY